MKSFQSLYTNFTDITGNSASANTTFGKALLNDSQRIVLATYGGKWPFLENTKNLTSAASTATYQLPVDCRKVMTVEFQQSSTVLYHPVPVEDPNFWNYLQSLNASASDVPQYWYQPTPRTISLWPTISSASKTMPIRYRKIVKDMTAADYTTGTITTWANGDDDITGATTTWTSAMAGRFIRVTNDGMWYEIASRSADTAIKTTKNFEGTAISAGSEAYTIGEMPIIPAEHADIILWRSLAIYYDQNDNPKKSDRYWRRYDGGYEAGSSREIGGALKKMFDEQYSGKSEEVFMEAELENRRLNQNNPPQSITGQSW